MGRLIIETDNTIDDLGFSVTAWKTLRKHGVVTIDDLLTLTSMPCWASRLLQCGKRTAWEIIMKMSEEGLTDEGELLRSCGYRFTEHEQALFRNADEHLVWMPMPRGNRNMGQNMETGV